MMTRKQVARFHEKVDRSGGETACWPFLGKAYARPGGVYYQHLRHPLARAAWSAARGGKDVPAARSVYRTCENPACTNPRHLTLDVPPCSRARRLGQPGARAKLTDAQALEVREAYAAGIETQREIAARFGLASVALIVTGQTYVRVGGPVHKAGSVDRWARLRKPPPTRAELAAIERDKAARVKAARVERFLDRCDRSAGAGGCWPWLGGATTAPVLFNRRPLTVTQAAWFFAHGKLPRKPLMVVRRCGNLLCANVAHMLVGTRKDRVLPDKPAVWRGREAEILAARLRGSLRVASAELGLPRRAISSCLFTLSRAAGAPTLAVFLKRERRRARDSSRAR